MKRTLEIVASFTGKISTGQYENESPFFSLKEIIECDNGDFTDEMMTSRQKQLHDFCREQFNRQAEVAFQEKIAKTYPNIRFYNAGDKKYPSVTSVIDMDKDFSIPQDELVQYGARGTILHKQAELFLKTGEKKEPKDMPEVAFEYMTVVKGNKGLLLDDVNFFAFYKEYPFTVVDLEKTVVNDEMKYAGRYDIKCVIDSKNKGKWDKVEGIMFDVPTILDIKTSATLDKTRGFTQQAAYAKCDPEVKQIGLIHLNNEVQAGYSKPVVTNNLERYQEIFKTQRNQFYKRYGI